MQAKITGATFPVLEIELQPGDKIVAEPGEFSWMSGNVQLNTTTQTAGAKGLFGVLGRAVSGGGLFMTEYTVQGGEGLIAFAARVPGSIMAVDVQPGKGYMIDRQGFLCATEGVELSIGFQKSLGAGIFGGNGFILQRLAGTCQAWVEALGGEIITYAIRPRPGNPSASRTRRHVRRERAVRHADCSAALRTCSSAATVSSSRA